ncbi:MAG: hypothetical protein KatS3mg110_0924 [Pirellulaceae bacterium]|nr:MAG: hypothetical protein KatS3mg110_0924 [Pirellulaceae bacterium]
MPRNASGFPSALALAWILVVSSAGMGSLAWVSTSAAQQSSPPHPIADDDSFSLQHGLLVKIASLGEPERSTWTIWKKAAFTLTGGSLAPQVPSGPFEVHFSGRLAWQETAPVRFAAFVRGDVIVKVGSHTVLDVRGGSGTECAAGDRSFSFEPGLLPVEIDYRSASDGTGRLQLWWESEEFLAEPIPAWRFYLPEELPEELALIERQEQGRLLAERFACGRCHPQLGKSMSDFRPGPALHDTARRLRHDWLMRWLENPPAVRAGTAMPKLFDETREGYIERWLVASWLAGSVPPPDSRPPPGDHRMGRRLFISVGCAACHFLPDRLPEEQLDRGQHTFAGLGDRWNEETLAEFLKNPVVRYPDGRMPQIPLNDAEARDIAAFLLYWSRSSEASDTEPKAAAPTDQELDRVLRAYQAATPEQAAQRIMARRGCGACHAGEGLAEPAPVTINTRSPHAGCLAGQGPVRFTLDSEARAALEAFLHAAAGEHDQAHFYRRQRQLGRFGCERCHQRDSDEPPPIEQIGATLGGAWLQRIPYQRTPRLPYVFHRLEHDYLATTVAGGIQQTARPQLTYRMPAFGHFSPIVLRALAEGDGEQIRGDRVLVDDGQESSSQKDPTAGSLYGPELVGFQGYACISCHAWKGKMLADPDPGAVAPDLVRTAGRVRRWWFDRILESPARLCPRTAMPAVLPRGKPALLEHLLSGDTLLQKDALWSYLSLQNEAPDPLPPPPWLIEPPAPGSPIRVAQIPLHLCDRIPIESIVLWDCAGRIYGFDVNRGGVYGFFCNSGIYRSVEGRRRRYLLIPPAELDRSTLTKTLWWLLGENDSLHSPTEIAFDSFQRHPDGATFYYQVRWPGRSISVEQRLIVPVQSESQECVEEWKVTASGDLVVACEDAWGSQTEVLEVVDGQVTRQDRRVVVTLPSHQTVHWRLRKRLAPSTPPVPPVRHTRAVGEQRDRVSLRPGYRAVAIPIPQSAWGEDAVMPSAVAVMPQPGRVFVASMKLGELWELTNPLGNPEQMRWKDYALGLFQEAYSMTAEGPTLYVLHRRNLTAVEDQDGDGTADRFRRVALLPHGIADTYDYGYGLVRKADGTFVLSFAPYANRHLPGSGGAVIYDPMARRFTELAYGMRNPVGWCSDLMGNIYFTDNQGEWVATNKLCRIFPGHFYGFPNPEQPQHADKPFGKTSVWIPYDWAHSINGVAVDNTGGKFGPFAGQFFLAELMFGGAIIRADIEEVNGVAQGVCFPFWQKGLLGPLCLAFHPAGCLFVGSITEPGWMAQPDRGGMFRIDFTGETPFEIQTIRITPVGFRLVFTRPVDAASAENPRSYRVEHFRYEYTGAYGSPELDRTQEAVQAVTVSSDRREVDVTLTRLIAGRVYMIDAGGVQSANGEDLVFPVGAYTVNEIPRR